MLNQTIDAKLNVELWQAVKQNDLTKVVYLFSCNTIPDVDAECPLEYDKSIRDTFLMRTIRSKQVTLFKRTIRSQEVTLLTWSLYNDKLFSASNDNGRTFDIILKYCSNVDKPNKDETTTLMRASHIDDSRSVGHLLEYGANPNLQDSLGNTALMWTLAKIKLENFEFILKSLIEAGADITIKNMCGTSPLLYFQKTMHFYADGVEQYKKYSKIITTAEFDRKRYENEKKEALQKIRNFILIKDLASIVFSYAYGIFPRDLPKSKATISISSLIKMLTRNCCISI